MRFAAMKRDRVGHQLRALRRIVVAGKTTSFG
jgi:hypothetical protein